MVEAMNNQRLRGLLFLPFLVACLPAGPIDASVDDEAEDYNVDAICGRTGAELIVVDGGDGAAR